VDQARNELETAVRAAACEAESWERAELHLLEQGFRERLALLQIDPTPDVAAALMAAACYFGEHTPEWGGDTRTTLCEIARLGLRLLEGDCPAS
jgi:hypothetical protein